MSQDGHDERWTKRWADATKLLTDETKSIVEASFHVSVLLASNTLSSFLDWIVIVVKCLFLCGISIAYLSQGSGSVTQERKERMEKVHDGKWEMLCG